VSREHDAETLRRWLGLQPTKQAENDRNFFGFGDREVKGLASENSRGYFGSGGSRETQKAIARRAGEEKGSFGGILSRRLF
jgi:hypothetical protein